MATQQHILITPAPGDSATQLTAREARALAKEAFVYGYPLVDNYRIQHAYFVNRAHPEYKGAWNEVHNTARVYTPQDKAIQSPNSDTPYSMIGVDLRTEPIVLSVPEIEGDRYYSVQFIDMYTFNFAYVGTRTTGNDAGNFLLAGPRWNGEKPAGVKRVFQCETEFAFLIIRTQLYEPSDIEAVKQIQRGYAVQPLSRFLGEAPPAGASLVEFIPPLTRDEQRSSLEFFNVLSFVLQFCPTHPSETELMARFARLRVGAGQTFDPNAFRPDVLRAIRAGIADAWATFHELSDQVSRGEFSSKQAFGTREELAGHYEYRAIAALLGIYGNSPEEAVYFMYSADSAGRVLDGANAYTLRFAPKRLPPVNAFWSLTMYAVSTGGLVPNAIDRYLINSPMLPSLASDRDGGITLHVQREAPGGARDANWLPAPTGPFYVCLRLYWPKPEASEGRWLAPKLERVPDA